MISPTCYLQNTAAINIFLAFVLQISHIYEQFKIYFFCWIYSNNQFRRLRIGEIKSVQIASQSGR